MTIFTPYTYFQCPCTDNSKSTRTGRNGEDIPAEEEENGEDERTFDPRAPRANYSLYPLEHLLYCEDCHQIRCPRCVLDEIVTWYCPNCLFEVPSSTVKSEGNRCTRSCFQCPICISPLSVSSLEAPPEGLGADQAPQAGPYVLNCGYCTWSSKEIGITFEKPNSIYSQLLKIQNGGAPMMTPKERRRDREEKKREAAESGAEEGQELVHADPTQKLDAESQFSNLKAFYQSQLADSNQNGTLGFTGDYGYGSPGALSRIMGLYTGGTYTDKKSKNKNSSMREAADAIEGLQISSLSNSDEANLQKLRTLGWHSTPSSLQRKEQIQSQDLLFISSLRPIANLLRTKRSKRCRTCRHILSKPESKVQTTRFRIRLVALNYIPSITIKPLLTPSLAQPSVLTPLKPVQFVLTFKNPLFDAVKISLATPAQTPGRFSSKVTVLCPVFEVGANTDMWDEALGPSSMKPSSSSTLLPGGLSSEKRRTKAEASTGQNPVAEAGKIWERGRNWVSVVVEIVPGSLRIEDTPRFLRNEEALRDGGRVREDEDVLEIPLFMRVEWETDVDAGHSEGGGNGGTVGAGSGGKEGKKGEEAKEKRELAYWCVLGVGKIARD